MIIFGKRVFFYVLERHFSLVEEIFLAKDVDKRDFAKIAKSGLKVQRLDAKKAQALARGGNHQGFLMRLKDFEFTPLNELKKDDFIVILCGISDVGNIGSIARTAYALGVKSLIIGAKSVAVEGVIRASSGAFLDLKVCLNDEILGVLNELKQLGFKIYGTSPQGKNVRSVNFSHKKCLILGSEGEGIPRKILAKCDESVSVEMKGDFDSLNVGAAFAILCDRMVNE